MMSPGEPRTVEPSIGHDLAGEPFDHVMARVLSPSETDEPGVSDVPDTASTVAERDANTISSPARRRRVQSRNATSEKPSSIAGETNDPSAQPGKNKSVSLISLHDAGKGRGDVATGSPATGETRIVAASHSAAIQFITAYLTSPFSLVPAATRQKDILDASGGLSPTTTAVSGPGSMGATVSRAGAETGFSPGQRDLNQIGPLAQEAGAEVISRLKPDGQIEKGMKAVDPAGGKMDSGNSQPVSPSVNDAKNPQSSTTTVKDDGKIKAGDFQPAPGVMDAAKGMEISAADLPTIENASAPVARSTQNVASTSPDLGVETMTPAPSETHGMSAAKVYTTMKKTEKMNKVAGLTVKTEKVLPVGTDSATPEHKLPVVEVDPVPRISPRNGPAMVVVGPSVKGPEQAEAPTADGVSASAAVDLRSRALDRTHDVLALHAMRLVDSQLDSLRVVIKPGAGMELSLEMRQHGDAIDARVVLQRGDFSHLSQHWPELQQRLEQRGIRLAPLTGGENSTTDGGANGFQPPRRELADQGAHLDTASVGLVPASSPIPSITSSTITVTAQRRWETWA